MYFTARIEDGDQIDDWDVTDHRTGEHVPLRADRWYQKDPSSDSCQAAISQAFKATYGIEPRSDASLHTLWLEMAVTTWVTML